MDFENGHERAMKVIKSANGAEHRLHNLMRTSFRNGALGVDSIKNVESRVYGETAKRTRERIERKREHTESRRGILSDKASSSKRLGYNVFHHNESVLPPEATKVFQRKNRSARKDPDTHERLFSDRKIEINPDRTQKLRNEQLRGKSWNITNGTKIVHVKSTVPYKVNRMQAHPSQASMERGANKQGFLDLRHVERCTSPFLPP